MGCILPRKFPPQYLRWSCCACALHSSLLIILYPLLLSFPGQRIIDKGEGKDVTLVIDFVSRLREFLNLHGRFVEECHCWCPDLREHFVQVDGQNIVTLIWTQHPLILCLFTRFRMLSLEIACLCFGKMSISCLTGTTVDSESPRNLRLSCVFIPFHPSFEKSQC